MSDSKTVRAWGSSQVPPLAAAEGRGRFSTPLIEAFNAAHPDDPYVPAVKAPKRAKPEVTPPPTADTTAEALRPDPFTSPVEASQEVTGEQVPDGVREAVEQAQVDAEVQSSPSRYAHILPVDPPEDAPHEYDTEKFIETP